MGNASLVREDITQLAITKNDKMESFQLMTNIQNQTYRPRLQYALLKFASIPILGIFSLLAIRLVPVFNEFEANGFRLIGYFVFTIFLVVYFYKVAYLCSIKYRFDNEHIEISKGIFSIQNDYVQYYRIKDLKRYRSLISRIIGTMDITLITSDKFNRSIFMNGIRNDKRFPNELRETIENERANKRVYEID